MLKGVLGLWRGCPEKGLLHRCKTSKSHFSHCANPISHRCERPSRDTLTWRPKTPFRTLPSAFLLSLPDLTVLPGSLARNSGVTSFRIANGDPQRSTWHATLKPDETLEDQKNPRAHKNKIGTPPPPKPKIPPPPKNEEFYGHGFFLRKERIFPGVHKIDAPISGPRIADNNFTDTRIFLRRGKTWVVAFRRFFLDSAILLNSGCFPWKIQRI